MIYIGKIQLSAPSKIPFDFWASSEQFENKDFYNLAMLVSRGIGTDAEIEFDCPFGKYRAIAMGGRLTNNKWFIKFEGASK